MEDASQGRAREEADLRARLASRPAGVDRDALKKEFARHLQLQECSSLPPLARLPALSAVDVKAALFLDSSGSVLAASPRRFDV